MTKYGSVKILSYFIVEKKRNMQFVKIQMKMQNDMKMKTRKLDVPNQEKVHKQGKQRL